ncbi:hypothetical protein ACHAWF_004275 [Thalassiosira exigua]
MAPSLKEVDAPSGAARGKTATAATSTSILPKEEPGAGGTTTAAASASAAAADSVRSEDAACDCDTDDATPSSSLAAAPPPRPPLVASRRPPPPPPPAAASSTIPREDPALVPPDESAFVHPPHFSSSDPFHVSMAEFDGEMRCPICREIYDKPVRLHPCGHGFCSECVRGCLRRTYGGLVRSVRSFRSFVRRLVRRRGSRKEGRVEHPRRGGRGAFASDGKLLSMDRSIFAPSRSETGLSRRSASSSFANPSNYLTPVPPRPSHRTKTKTKTPRTRMKRRADCPQCNAPVRPRGSSSSSSSSKDASEYEKGIIPDRLLERQADAYRKVRDGLRERLVRLDVLERERAAGAGAAMGARAGGGRGEGAGRRKARGDAPRGGRGPGKERSKRPRREGARKVYLTVGDDDEDGGAEGEGEEDVNDSGDDDGEDYANGGGSSDDDEENCDGRGDRKKQKSKTTTSAARIRGVVELPARTHAMQLKPRTIVNYHGVKRKRLIELCAIDGLHTTGTDEELKRRHADFVALYNSELTDSAHPRSAAELAKEVRKREDAARRAARDADATRDARRFDRLGASLRARGEGKGGGGGGGGAGGTRAAKVSSGSAAFDAEMDGNYERMIADVRERMKREKEKGKEGTKTEQGAELAADAPTSAAGASVSTNPAASRGDEAGEGRPGAALAGDDARTGPAADAAASPAASADARGSDATTVEAPRRGSGPSPSPPRAEARRAGGAGGDVGAGGDATRRRPPPRRPRPPIDSAQKRKRRVQPSSSSAAAASASSRVAALGPWTCGRCTYHNERNVTRKCKCEMCEWDRPEPEAADKLAVEVVNLDC